MCCQYVQPIKFSYKCFPSPTSLTKIMYLIDFFFLSKNFLHNHLLNIHEFHVTLIFLKKHEFVSLSNTDTNTYDYV